MNNIIDKQKILQTCSALTQGGKVLRIDWSGGNDSGYYETQVDGLPVEEGPDLLEIHELVSCYTGNWSFADDYHSTGYVLYDSDRQVLVGEDNAESSDNAAHACYITIEIPKSLWFDRLNIYSEDWESMSVLVELAVMNGPRSEQHALLEIQIAREINSLFQKELAEVENLIGISMSLSLNLSELQENSESWIYVIKEIVYSYRSDVKTELLITLND